MPVFNAAANQVLVSPVTNYYQGKAIRLAEEQAKQDMEFKGLQIEQAKMEIADAPRRMKELEAESAARKEKMGLDIDNLRRTDTEGSLGFIAKASQAPLSQFVKTAMTDPETGEQVSGSYPGAAKAVEEWNSVYVNDLIKNLPPKEQARMTQYAGEDKKWSLDEIVKFGDSQEAYIKGDAPKPTASQQVLDDLVANKFISPKQRNQILLDQEIKAGTTVGRTDVDAGFMPGADSNPTQAKQIRDVVGSTDNLLSSMERISDLVDKAPQASLGLPGEISELVDQSINAVDGFAEIAGGWAEINGTEVPSSSLLDLRLYKDYFEKLSVSDAAIEANAVGVSYALARAANPDGRISDADVRHQLERLQLNQSSKARIRASIKEVRRESLSSAMNWLRVSGATRTDEGRKFYSEYERALTKMKDKEDTSTEVPQATRQTATLADGTKVQLSADGLSWEPVK